MTQPLSHKPCRKGKTLRKISFIHSTGQTCSVIKILSHINQNAEETDLQVLLHTHYSHPQIHDHSHIHLLEREKSITLCSPYFLIPYPPLLPYYLLVSLDKNYYWEPLLCCNTGITSLFLKNKQCYKVNYLTWGLCFGKSQFKIILIYTQE